MGGELIINHTKAIKKVFKPFLGMAYLGALGVVMTRKDAQQFVVFIITILAHVPQQTHRTNRCQESLDDWRLPCST